MDHLNHANHNYNACGFLKSEGKYNDWVVTTAFYSCMHYLYVKAFPDSYIVNNKKSNFSSFHIYYKEYKRFNPTISKHNATIDIGAEIFPGNIAAAYKALYDDCHSARYKNYNVLPIIVETSLNSLECIRQYCSVTVTT